MDWVATTGAVGALCSVLGAGVGVIAKSAVDWSSGSRKQYIDQLQLALKGQEDLRGEMRMQAGQIHNLQEKITELAVSKMKLETENTQFRRDIIDLQRQVRTLGHEPAVPEIP